ncbi:WD40 repeat domain-containing protein [Actinoplanes sp. NPDC051411]|uniref:WD40 repeat domain-containing protein n=1 Tax=Actinoplanes sp. NPDC051411 TaxID=3155522 RepID=UPI003444D078
MPRPERALDSTDGPVSALALELRALRSGAGGPAYRELARHTAFSATTLAEAAGGRRMPTLEVTLAYVKACGGDLAEWEDRWQATMAALTADRHDDEEAEAPYPGLRAFQFADADRFFGREQLVGRLVRDLSRRRFLAVFGASGSGKSSLLRAGLLPAVAAGDADLRFAVLTPGVESMRHLSAALGASPPDLLVVDQFEEVFTLCTREEERRRFIDALLDLTSTPVTRSATAIKVVIGVRADFYPRCGSYPRLVTAMHGAQVLVGSMTADELREAICQPAVQAGFSVERALSATVVSDALRQSGALPLVSHAMRETWLRRRGNVLTLAGYQAAGGVEGALARTAERVYSGLTDQQQLIARDLLLRLTALGEGTEDTRRRLTRAEVEDLGSADLSVVLERLAAVRLLTLDAGTVDVGHEALIRCWPKLRGWLTADREGLRMHRQLTEAADAWRTLDHDQGVLYRGARLTAVREWLHRSPQVRLSGSEQAFLDASVAAEQRERHAADRRARARRLATVALSVLLVFAVAGGATAVVQRGEAVTASHAALSRQKAAETVRALNAGDVEGALESGLDAYQAAPTVEGRSALLSADSGWGYHGQLRGHAGLVPTVAFQPGGYLLASGGQDGEIILWDAARRQRTGQLPGHRLAVRSLQFSPDGTRLASASSDGTVMIWDVARRRAVRTLTGHTGAVTGLAFSPDGTRLASTGVDRTVRLWRVADGAPLARLRGPGGSRPEVAFSPDGVKLASVGAAGTVTVWDTRRDTALVTLAASPMPLYTVAFSPDGRLLAEGGQDRVIQLWDTRTWTVAMRFQAHSGQVRGLAFTPDSALLVSAAYDRTAMIWDLRRKGRLVTLPGQSPAQYDVALSSDGRMIATAIADQTILLWDRSRLPLAGHTGTVEDLAFRPDGGLLASASDDGSIALWDPARRTLTSTLPGHPGGVAAVAYSADGRLLASGGWDRTVALWDDRRNTPTATLPKQADIVTSLAIQPGNRLLAAGLGDGTVVLWDLTDRTRTRQLRAHRLLTNDVAFSPDGRLLAAASLDRTVTVWQVATGTLLATLRSDGLDQQAVAFSPDGRRLAAGGGDGVIRIWDVARRTVAATLTGHVGPVTDLAYRADGRYLASAGADHSVIIWDTAGARAWARLSGLSDPVTSVAWSPDGQQLASAGGDQMVTLWPTGPERAAADVCRRLEHDFGRRHAGCPGSH